MTMKKAEEERIVRALLQPHHQPRRSPNTPNDRERHTERVHFRLIEMPCCQHLFCNVNARLPSHCPQCGKFVYDQIKGGVLISDATATLKYTIESPPEPTIE
jgi:hypothetical protein